jgi:ComF family protein
MNGFSFLRSLADFFLPPRCPLCGTLLTTDPNMGFCSSCFGQMKFLSRPQCPRCGRPFLTPEEEEDHLCGQCLTEERYFAKARAVAYYEGKVAEAIWRLKYRGGTHLAKPLARLLIDYQNGEFFFSDFDRIVPVPLSEERLRERGFNQSLLLARPVSRNHGVPLDFQILQRLRHTQPQTQLSAPERERNIRGAFAVRNPQRVRKEHILILDDVFTTGATARECARVLLHAGARQVDVLTLARTP